MSHQDSWRKGWQSQNIARVILYKFCFLSEPVYIADDIGGDFFCTLFETKRKKSNADLLPRNSFWIQLKSKGRSKISDLSSVLPMFRKLEIPFFIGMVDREKSTLTIFSGHYLTPLFAYKGPTAIKHLRAKLYDKAAITGLYDDYFEETPKGTYTLYFPRVAEIAQNSSNDDLEETVKAIRESCSLMLENIATGINQEHTFKNHDGTNRLLFAGPGSLQSFQPNFAMRLAEVFFNLHIAYTNPQNRTHVQRLFDAYERIYNELVSLYGMDSALVSTVRAQYQGAKSYIKGSKS